MDEDDYDDISDEDLMLAFDQAQNPSLPTATNSNPSTRPSFASAPNTTANIDLEDFFSDASDGFEETGHAVVQRPGLSGLAARSSQRPLARSQSFRQTTLFGQTVRDESQRQSQTLSSRPFRADLPPDIPSHHALNPEAMKTWVYPMNLGAIRDYQFSIVKTGLFNNTLVSLPTGLGKTFIAAAIMLNFYRWTQKAKIVFVAPTKPLVSQQVEACLNIAGIPRSDTTLLTGETPPVLREGEWETKRLFFMTPQTLMNDLSKGYADPKSIVLLVVDEAHRATGDYAYVKVVEFLRRFSKSFRVIALTATPGSKVESVQQVIDSLGISHVEIRTEESIDIRQYVHSRKEDIVTLEPSDEILRIQELFSKALKPFVDKLSQQNIYWGRDPMSLTTFGLRKTQEAWMSGPGRHANQGLKFATGAVFSMLQGLAHSIKLLNYHGIQPFYDNLKDFRSEVEERGEKGPKMKNQLLKDPNFQEMMRTIEKWLKLPDFVGHPKMTYLCDTLLNHFMDAGQGSSTRAIVFSEYRDSAEGIVRALNAHKPLISAAVFVGQADSKRSEGMKQKQQIETIERFKTGGFNVLVATSIGEEGLDIGQVDLIVCYDASSSPIRMLQRMGRTGRKRAGKIVLLLMKGKEEEKFAESKDNYEKMQKMIENGSRFAFRHDLSSRIVPPDIRPEVDKCLVDIPIENTQDRSLPEPKKTAAGLRRKPAKKKFHMPDGAETGFKTVSSLLQQPGRAKAPKKPAPVVEEQVADVPALDSVCLSESQASELAVVYKYVPYQGVNSEEIALPDVTRFPRSQRSLRPTVKLKHGGHTKRCVRLFRLLGKSQDVADRYVQPYGEDDKGEWKRLAVPPFGHSESSRGISDGSRDEEEESLESEALPRRRTTAPSKKQSKQVVAAFIDSADDDDDEEEEISEEEEPDNAPTPVRGRGGGRTAARSTRGGRKAQRGGSRLKRKGDHFEDLGDDCERTSDINDTDGSDSGADLEDFVVGDDQVISSIPSSLPSFQSTALTSGSPASGLPSSTSKGAQLSDGALTEDARLPGWMDVTPTQDSNRDLPDIDELFNMGSGGKAAKRKTSPVDISEDETEVDDDDVVRRPAATKRRRVLADSDDE
ncbi:P-loop containing nucleoside triphosphate hydrolase protein [Coniochaeta ligniaria NRRL 30616]|uniref:ATP-dependent DNA helicase n=1 Tax=Coniochaeta ligniaria NRRL 30616 TaxID=1408157 RepID=A0A1J7J664_9PEZI|nr:P-loop containing nucleoside triphosphate hydrolase protein [Coniochaeta ligniaria NRRL 30616]